MSKHPPLPLLINTGNDQSVRWDLHPIGCSFQMSTILKHCSWGLHLYSNREWVIFPMTSIYAKQPLAPSLKEDTTLNMLFIIPMHFFKHFLLYHIVCILKLHMNSFRSYISLWNFLFSHLESCFWYLIMSTIHVAIIYWLDQSLDKWFIFFSSSWS